MSCWESGGKSAQKEERERERERGEEEERGTMQMFQINMMSHKPLLLQKELSSLLFEICVAAHAYASIVQSCM